MDEILFQVERRMHKMILGILLLTLAACSPAAPAATQSGLSIFTNTPPEPAKTESPPPAAETPAGLSTAAGPAATVALQGDIPYTPGAGLPPGLVYSLGLEGLWRIDANGRLQQINDGYQPVLSPDGTQVLFSVAYEGDIWLADLQTGEKRNLTNTPENEERGYRWWPGKPGAVLFYYRPMNEAGMSSGSLGMVRTDGSGYQVIDPQGGSLGDAAPAPDGYTIAFDQGGRPVLYTDGQGIQPLDLAAYGVQADQAINPAWSPDGRRLAWVITSGGQNGVAVLDMESRQGLQLHPFSTGFGGMQPELAWSPDGRWLALTSYGEAGKAGPVIWALDAAGNEEIAIGNGVNPMWSPDGRFLAYTYTPPGAGSYLEDQTLVVQAGVWQPFQLDLEPGAHVVDWVRVSP
jgi:Tol biopolymer transport system component